MTTITKDAVTEALHAAVAAKGADYVYPNADPEAGGTCRYTEPDGSPSCIVGHVVAALDPEAFETLVAYEISADDSFGAAGLTMPHRYGGYRPSEEKKTKKVEFTDADEEIVVEALTAAQIIQDEGHVWGESEEAYDRVLAGENRFDVVGEIRRRTRVEV